MSNLIRCQCGKSIILLKQSASSSVCCPDCGGDISIHAAVGQQSSIQSPDDLAKHVSSESMSESLDFGNEPPDTKTPNHYTRFAIVSVAVLLLSTVLGITFLRQDGSMVSGMANHSGSERSLVQVSRKLQPPDNHRLLIQQEEERRKLEKEQRRLDEKLRQDEERRRFEEEQRQLRVLDEAIKQVVSKGPTLLKAAHPFATFAGVEHKTAKRQPNGDYRLVFDVEYITRFLKATCWLEMYVVLDDELQFKDMGWGRDTGVIPPGAALAIASQLLEELLKKNP